MNIFDIDDLLYCVLSFSTNKEKLILQFVNKKFCLLDKYVQTIYTINKPHIPIHHSCLRVNFDQYYLGCNGCGDCNDYNHSNDDIIFGLCHPNNFF